MTTDITELAQRARINAECGEHLSPAETMELVEALEKSEKTSEARREAIDITHKRAARERDRANAAEETLEKAQGANGYLREQSAEWERKAISNFEDCAEMSARIEELESQRKLAFTASNRWADKFREAEQRIAELESRTVKLPVHPTIASEKLDDETLQELIEFRRTTFEYHSKEGNKVQTIIHGVTLAALRELQERRKTEKDSEPVCFVSERNLATLTKYRAAVKVKAEPVMVRPVALYRHVQQPVVPDDGRADFEAWVLGVHGGDISKACFPDGEDYANAHTRCVWKAWSACRAAMLQAGNSPVIPDGYVMVPKEPTEAMMLHNSGCQHHAWDDPDCAMRQTRRLIWSHMLAAAPQEVKGE